MLRRSLAYGLSLLALLTAITARGEAEYWVSVGSYKNLVNAEIAQREASAKLPESFSISEADTSLGFFLRVVAGPYLTREIADHMLGEAQRAGFSSAWILITESTLSTLPSYGSELSMPADADLNLPEYQPAGEPLELPTFKLEDRPERSTEHRVIDVAPDDYHLHRLHRDQSAIDWSSPFLLATTESAVIRIRTGRAGSASTAPGWSPI